MSASSPLNGTRIVDFSWLLPGPFCTHMLQDLGAEVTKIEPPSGDYIKEMMPGAHEVLNSGKTVCQIDLKDPAGLRRALDLCTGADAVVEGFRPGVADRLGIGFDAVCRQSPGVVYCSISGFGQTGARSAEPGHDLAYQATAGAYAAVLAIGEDPTRSTLPVGDLAAGSIAAMTICATLADRERVGATHLDLAMAEAVAYFASASRWGRYPVSQDPITVEDLASYSPGNGLYRTSDDKWVAIAAVEDKFWTHLTDALDRPDLGAPPLDAHRERMRERARLTDEVAREIGSRSLASLLSDLRSAGVPVTPLQGAEEVCADGAFRDRGAITETAGGFRVSFPVTASGSRIGNQDQRADPAGQRKGGQVTTRNG